MHVYTITFDRSGTHSEIKVVARSAERALELFRKYDKKKYYTSSDLIRIWRGDHISAVQK